METNLVEVMKEEKDLYNALMYYRLNADLDLLDEKITNNEPVEEKETDNVFVKAWNKNIVNPIRKSNSDRIENNKKKVLEQITKFKDSSDNANYINFDSEERIKDLIGKIYANDKYNMSKTYLGIRFALDKTYEFVNESKTLEKVSKLLFNDEDKLTKLKNGVFANYLDINKRSLNDIEMGILVSLGLVSAASLIAVPLTIVAAPILAELSTVAFVASAVMLCGTLSAIEIKEMYDNDKLLKAFEKISPEEVSLIFAIKVAVLEETKDAMELSDLKEELDSILKLQDELRSDAEYMLIVEKVDPVNYKKKISACNNMSSRLATVAGV